MPITEKQNSSISLIFHLIAIVSFCDWRISAPTLPPVRLLQLNVNWSNNQFFCNIVLRKMLFSPSFFLFFFVFHVHFSSLALFPFSAILFFFFHSFTVSTIFLYIYASDFFFSQRQISSLIPKNASSLLQDHI